MNEGMRLTLVIKGAKESGDFEDFCKKHHLEEEKTYSFMKVSDHISSPSTSSLGDASEINFDPSATFLEAFRSQVENVHSATDNKALLNNKYMRTKRSKPF